MKIEINSLVLLKPKDREPKWFSIGFGYENSQSVDPEKNFGKSLLGAEVGDIISFGENFIVLEIKKNKNLEQGDLKHSILKSDDLLRLKRGHRITKRNLYDLIQFSKVPKSPYWNGDDSQIGNTPQQGINWIGKSPSLKGVIIKSKEGIYADDGWSNGSRDSFNYSFKANKGVVNLQDKANAVLIKQPRYSYPILLFSEDPESELHWRFKGFFEVNDIKEKFVSLSKLK
jgi:hypothetical protein